MALRTFQSTGGTTWRVWSVIPGSRPESERRRGYDRRSPEPVLRYGGPERRAATERRRPGLVSVPLAGGWLVFEGPTERRRLVPIPPGWDHWPDAELERLCARAQPVLPTSPSPTPPQRDL
ncbi:MAG TPA: hypothetical protein VFX98_13535 [Longimicrobiaceae bacterium]|nr:hypothetical protein [Longimicrobiaceae bacterium]